MVCKEEKLNNLYFIINYYPQTATDFSIGGGDLGLDLWLVLLTLFMT